MGKPKKAASRTAEDSAAKEASGEEETPAEVSLRRQESVAGQHTEEDTDDDDTSSSRKFTMRPQIEPYDPKGALSFSEYMDRWSIYFEDQNVESRAKQKSMFLNYQNNAMYALICKVVLPRKVRDKEVTLDVIQKGLETYYEQSEPSKLVFRDKFYQRSQGHDESAVKFVTELARLADKCQFKEMRDEQLISRIVSGMRNEKLKLEFLAVTADAEAQLTLEVVVNKLYAAERAEASAKSLAQVATEETTVNKMGQFNKKKISHKLQHNNQNNNNQQEGKQQHSSQGYSQQQNKQDQGRGNDPRCYRCLSKNHDKNECSFINAECYNCGKKGHMAKVCKAPKKQKQYTGGNKNYYVEDDRQSEAIYQEQVVTNYLNQMEMKQTPASQKITLFIELNKKPLMMEVDSGATFSLIGWSTFCNYVGDKKKLQPSKVRMKAWGQNEELVAAGSLPVTLWLENKVAPVTVDLLVMHTNGPSLIGRNWFETLGIHVQVPRIHLQEQNQSATQPVEDPGGVFRLEQVPENLRDFADVFSPGLGKCKGEKIHIELREDAQPSHFPPRQVPFALRERASKALDELESAGVLRRVTESEWATPVVWVEKNDGKVRLCADYSVTINKKVKKSDFPLPTLDQLLSEVKPNAHYAKLDLADAYLQHEVDDQTAELLTITTHQGLYQFTRLPPGLSVAPPIFQKKTQTLLSQVEGVFVYFDDVFINAPTKALLNQRTRKVLQVFKQNGLKVKISKCAFDVPELEYLGYRFTQQGIQPTDEKIKAIMEMRPPANLEELRSYLGLIKKDVPFVWTQECQEAMDTVKGILCAAPALAFYDPTKKIRLTSDGSRKGIGAVLSHVHHGEELPVIFISRALKKAEKNYSQVEIEALAVTWAFKKLKKFLWGREVEVLTDHKPLIRIFDSEKPIPDHLSSKLKRYCLFLREFAYTILFMAGKDIPNADVLSRLPLPNLEGETEEFGGDFKIAFLQHSNVENFLDIQELQKATDEDEELSRVKSCILRGTEPAALSQELNAEFTRRWNELGITHGVICLSERAVIPRSLRPKVLKFLHLNHFGASKMKSLARAYFWWPKLDDDITKLAQACQPCALVNKSPNMAQVIPWAIPHRPWSRVHLDFFEVGRGRSFIVAADGLSGWIDCEETSGMTSAVAIKFCRRLFRQQGLCDRLVADNGPGFRAEEFRKFCSSNGVELIFSPPYSPATNGVAERAVQTVKQFLRKTPCVDWANRLDSFILGHNSTPRASGVAPAEFNLGRRPLTVLDKIHPAAEWTRKQAERDRRVAASATSGRQIPEEGREVTFRNFGDPNKRRWQQGRIKKVLGPRRLMVEDQDGVQHERHVDQVKFHPPARPDLQDAAPTGPEPGEPPEEIRPSGRPVRATRLPDRLRGFVT